MKKTKKKKISNSFVIENLQYVNIISKIDDMADYIVSYHNYLKNNCDTLKFIERIKYIIGVSEITNDEFNYLNKTLETKIVYENYTVGDILFEINTIKNNKLSNEKKYEKIKCKLNESFIKYSNSYNSKVKKFVPNDLKKYNNMNEVKSIIYSPIGTKR